MQKKYILSLRAQKNLEWFASEKLSMDRETWPEHFKQFKFIELNSVFKKVWSNEHLLKYGEETVINIGNKFITVSLNPSTVSELSRILWK